jgi:hypothetical protein
MNASQRTSTLVLILAIAGELTGCTPERPKARYTVDEYLANPDAMNAKLEECTNNPGDLASDPDCVNVRAAAERKGVGSLRDLPPMGLATPEQRERADPNSKSAESPPRTD